MKEILENVIQALNAVEVHGEKNLNVLLACIQTLTNLVNAGAGEVGVSIHESNDKQEP